MMWWFAGVALALDPGTDALVASCSGGDLDGCAKAGAALMTAGDVAQGGALLAGACDRGHAVACYDLGSAVVQPTSPVYDPVQAGSLFSTACAINFAPACADLAELYRTGVGVVQDQSAAETLFGSACTDGVGGACAALVSFRADDERVLVHQACELGHARSCGRAGFLSEQTAGDDAAALKSFHRGCDLGDVESCHFVVLRTKGTEAVSALQKACELGAGESCQALGVMALKGAGLPTADAPSWLRKACELERGTACLMLGAMYLEGRGVTQDESMASTWMARACALGEASACR